MRILQVTNGFPPTANAGVESHTHALARHLHPTHHVHIFCREADQSKTEYTVLEGEHEGIPVTRVVNNLLHVTEYEHLYRDPRIDSIFAGVLGRFQPDVIHIQHCIGLSTGCLELALATNVPVIVTLHDYWYICPTVNLLLPDRTQCAGTHCGANCFNCIRLMPRELQTVARVPLYHTLVHRVLPLGLRQQLFSLLARVRAKQEGDSTPVIARRVAVMRDLLNQASTILTPSQHVKNKYIEFGVRPELIRVLPLGMNVERWLNVRHAPRDRKERLRFGYAGSFLPTKGADVIVRAFKQVPGNMELYLCGFEPPGHTYPIELKALIRDDPRIHYVGSVPNETLADHFAGWDALLMPTLVEETFSFVVREALLAGLPVFASDIPVLREVIHESVNGHLLPVGSVEAWADTLRRLVAEPERLTRLQPHADTSFAKSYTANAEDHIALYEQLLLAVESESTSQSATRA